MHGKDCSCSGSLSFEVFRPLSVFDAWLPKFLIDTIIATAERKYLQRMVVNGRLVQVHRK